MYNRVKPGAPWWWWFSIDGQHEVYRIVRDGSGGLWVNDNGEGCALEEFRGKPIEPVRPAQEVDTHETLCMTAEELASMTGESIFYMVQQQRTISVEVGVYFDVWEAVQPFFTFNAAEKYIHDHDADLQNPRVMEMSAEDNPEWRAIQKLFFKTQG